MIGRQTTASIARGMSIPPKAMTLFESLCDGAADVDVDGLRLRVHQHLHEIRRAADKNELLPVDLAERLAGVLDQLLKSAGSLPAEHLVLVVGAARYFCSEDDLVGDTSSVLGLDDDIAVFNHVARQIGRPDLVFNL